VTAAPGGDRVARPRRELHDSLSAAAVAVLMAGLVWYLGCAGAARQSGSTAGRSADLGAPGQDPIGPAAAPLTEQMLILCWDGAQYNHTMTALRQGELPNLARIIAAGGVSKTLITDHATETKSAHAQMFTGYGPDVTGNSNGKTFQPLPRELSVFGRLNQHFGASNIDQVWVSSKSERVSSLPGEVWQYCRLDLDVWDGDIHRSHEITGPLILSYLATAVDPDRPFLFFGHFTEPDSPGHTQGENSPRYHGSIVALDRVLGEIVERLDALGMADTAAVCVCADHGFDEGGKWHKDSPDAWLATTLGPLRPVGDQKDMAPTILSAFGIDPATMDPLMPGSALWADGGAAHVAWPGGDQVRVVTQPPRPAGVSSR